MKKLFLFLVVLGGFASFLKAQVVTIPDAKFKAYLVNNSNINTNGDTEIQVSEATAFTGKIDCGGRRIVNLTGIEAFVNITQLSCYNNQLNALDVTKNTALITLHCYFNQLTALDVSKNTALIQLLCSNNQLTALDVSKNTALKTLNCDNNQLIALDVNKNTDLKNLDCYANQLTTLDISKNTALAILYCYSNQLTVLDVSKNTALVYLDFSNNQLTALDVSKNNDLIQLLCSNNQLTALDVTNKTDLIRLYCSNNQLTALDVSKNTNLIDLSCYNNQLGSLDIKNGKNNIMTYMYAYNNPSLACIQVDNVTNANSYTGGGRWLKNETASYSTNCSAMSTTDITKNQIIAYPNPVKDLLNFSEEVSNIKIADISGKVVKQISTTGKSINVANLKNGVYIISAKTKSGKDINQKIIKE